MDNRNDRKPRDYPEVSFTLLEDPATPEEIAELVAKRDALLLSMGYLPPDDQHEYWWNPKEEKTEDRHSEDENIHRQTYEAPEDVAPSGWDEQDTEIFKSLIEMQRTLRNLGDLPADDQHES